MMLGDLAQCLEAIHTRHLEVERDNVRPKLVDLLESEAAVHGGADNLDGVVALENLRNQFPHESGIVYYEDAHRFAHACAPLAPSRPMRPTTAWIFRMSTTV